MKRPALSDIRAMNRRLKAGFIAENKKGELPSDLLTAIDVLNWAVDGTDSRTIRELSKWLDQTGH